jgi:hypothetical protein
MGLDRIEKARGLELDVKIHPGHPGTVVRWRPGTPRDCEGGAAQGAALAPAEQKSGDVGFRTAEGAELEPGGGGVLIGWQRPTWSRRPETESEKDECGEERSHRRPHLEPPTSSSTLTVDAE